MKIDKTKLINKRKSTIKLKILLLFLLVTIVGIYTKSVSAVDLNLQAVHMYDEGQCSEGCLIYRIIVKPFDGTFDDLKNKPNQWVGYEHYVPDNGQYSASFLVFTSSKLGNYSGSGNAIGYASYNMIEAFKLENVVTFKNNTKYNNEISDIYNKLTSMSVDLKNGNLGNDALYTYSGNTTKTSTNNFSTYTGKFINIGNPITLGDSNSPIGYYTKGVDSSSLNYNANITIYGIEYKELRNMLVTPSSGADSTNSFYVADVLIDSKTTEQLKTYKRNNESSTIYVSAIPRTRSNGRTIILHINPWCFIKCF